MPYVARNQDGSIYGRWATKQWEGQEWLEDSHPDLNKVSDVADRKNSYINSSRLVANQSMFAYAGKQIACDPLSRSDIDGVAGRVALQGAFAPGFPMQWKAVDNTYVSIPDVATFKSFYDSMVVQGTTNFLHAQDLKNQMNSIVADVTKTDAEKITAIEAIKW